ncbi:hypothetical protein MLD38_016236 [Melastoma candidum]|uniref:Uncharacterized protein n=1 Tax=Melastoma candidum TaxID=119954 RepID=A0ACB9RIC7_9MYRT|nr:hypothetical protein MLD38_016236 [Melastoma candidum]
MRFPGHGPGCRFHPTDEELTMYYLKKKVMRRKFFHDGIQERDVYNLDPRDLKGQEHGKGDLKWQLGWEEDEFVLCVIFEKEGPGPRNGAQYGARYREEDWDDVNEEPNNCEENDQGVDSMLQVHDPTDKGKSTDLNESNWAVDTQLPLTDEGSISFHEIPSVSLGHEQGLNIGVEQGVSSELAIPDFGKNVYEDLVDLFSLDDICDSGVNACDNDSLANQNILPDDFMEVDECRDGSDSFEGLHDPAVPKQPTSFGAVIPNGILTPTFIGQQNLSVGVSDIIPSWNRHHCEPAAPTDHFTNGTQTMGFDGQSCGGYQSLWEHDQFSDGLSFLDFGDDVSNFNQDNQLNAGPLGFGGQGFGENLPGMSPNLQFFQDTDGFVSQSLRGHVPPLHGPQFAEDSAWRGPGSVQNVIYLNQRPQTAGGSIWLRGQESIMNGRMDNGFAANGAAAPFGNVLPPQSMPRGTV